MPRLLVPHGLWRDVPPERRITLEFLRTRNGARQPGWVDKIWKRCTTDGDYCAAAARWSSHPPRYMRCGIDPAPGEMFCHVHGGALKPKPVPKKKRHLSCLSCGHDMPLVRSQRLCDRCVRSLTHFEWMFNRGATHG